MFGNAEEIVKRSEKLRAQMWNDFERIRPGLVEIARHFYPQGVRPLVEDVRNLAEPEQSDKDDLNRTTGVPRDAFRICVNGFYVHLTGPNTRWFKLGNPTFGRSDEEADDYYGSVYEELTDATDWLMKWCGAYKPMHVVYRHLTAFGFAAFISMEDDERYVRCEALRVGTYAFGIDRKGKVNRLVRRFAMTAEMMIDEFGAENVSENVVRLAEAGDTRTKFEVWCLIEPHVKRGWEKETPYTLSYEKFTYRSVYWTNGARDRNFGLLAVRGHELKPMVCPRINHEDGEVYGRGMCADALGMARMLQTMREDCLDIDDQNAHPSMMAPASMSDEGLKLDPLSVNWYPDGVGKDAVYRTVRDGLDTEGVRFDAEIAERELRKALLNSEFETINTMEDGAAQGGNMTATEVHARVGEKLEQLSGIATTLNEEWLDPLVTMMCQWVRLASIHAGKSGGLPAIVALPEELVGSDTPFDIKYESKIHAAANATAINAGFDSLSRAASVAESNPEVMDNFDFDAAVRETHRLLGAPEKWLRPAAERDEQREARAEKQTQAEELQRQSVQAKAIRDVASAPIDPSSLGGAIASAGQEGGF